MPDLLPFDRLPIPIFRFCFCLLRHTQLIPPTSMRKASPSPSDERNLYHAFDLYFMVPFRTVYLPHHLLPCPDLLLPRLRLPHPPWQRTFYPLIARKVQLCAMQAWKKVRGYVVCFPVTGLALLFAETALSIRVRRPKHAHPSDGFSGESVNVCICACISGVLVLVMIAGLMPNTVHCRCLCICCRWRISTGHGLC